MIKNWNSYNESHGIDDEVKSIYNHIEKIRSNFIEFEDSEDIISYEFKLVATNSIHDIRSYEFNRDWKYWIDELTNSLKSILDNISKMKSNQFFLNEKYPYCLVTYIKMPVVGNIPGRPSKDLIDDESSLENVITIINRLKDDYDKVLFGLVDQKSICIYVYFN